MGKQTLTRKELVERIRQTMPSDFNEIEKLAFIEYEVAKNISFDEKYLWGDRETKEKIYKLAKKEAQRPHKEIKRKLICVTMAELFGYVAKALGFNVRYQTRAPGYEIKSGENEVFKSISDKRQEHVCPIVRLSNGSFIEIDIQSDLSRLQTRSKPKAFGMDRHGTTYENEVKIQILNKSTIDNAFKNVYQLEENERFTDEYIMVFSAMLSYQDKTPIEMLEFFMNDPKILKELQNTKCIEANKLYKKILEVCYDFLDGNQFFKEQDKAIIEECILSNDKGQKRYSFCVYVQNDEQKKFYIYSKKSRRMVNLSQEEIQQMTGQVMNVQLRGRPSELKNEMMGFITGDKAAERKAPVVTTTLEDIFIDEDEDEEELE